MPGVISRSKRSTRGSSNQAATNPPPASNTINITKLSKLPSLSKGLIEKKAAAIPRTSSIEIVLSSRKRRASDDDVESSSPSIKTPKKLRREEPKDSRLIAAATPISKKRKSVRFVEQENIPPTPSSKPPPTPSSSRKRRLETDETQTLLERLNLQSPIRKRTKNITVVAHLPQELLDLLDLQVAFLKALSVQYAHNGTTSPIDLRTLYPSITRTWGKRQVTLEDIQRCIGILNWTPVKSSTNTAPFFISDYGRSKVCIDFHSSITPGPLREEKLNMDFESNLRTLWLSSNHKPNTTLFIGTLPKAAIKQCTSALPLISGHQRTLEELKNGIFLRKQQEKEVKEAKAAVVATTLNPDGTKMSLLERIRIREAQQSQGVQGPTLEERQRQAALHRAEDVSAVIGMLCSVTARGQARVSFAMSAMMVKLKDSLRTPISQEDGVFCVRLLAKEVAPQWLRILSVGGREHVVVTTAGQPSLEQVKERVKVLLG
ncbi:hypothetical protein QBC44DRAFT_267391 [Cladorrhinum sp. PSN332]|nr:hypothetical protein QBC44DRAFT_267391 [Cladorrhinum sp. PSN332]